MSLRDPSPTRFIVVGKGAAVVRFYSAVYIANDGLQFIFHIVETNLQRRRYEDFSKAR